MVLHFYSNFNRTFCSNNGDPDQKLHSVTSDLGLHCLPSPHKKDAGLIWVKKFINTSFYNAPESNQSPN